MCSNDWVDQFYNPAHQAKHHVHTRLRIQPKLRPDCEYLIYAKFRIQQLKMKNSHDLA